jgi:ABC-type amino acid transport system permease subunit
MRVSEWILAPDLSHAGELQLVEELGPRARRRAMIATAAALALIVGGLAWVVLRFKTKHQFDSQLWAPYKSWGSWRFLIYGLGNTIKAGGVAALLALIIGTTAAVWRSERGTQRPREVIAGLAIFFGLLAAIPAWLNRTVSKEGKATGVSGNWKAVAVIGVVVIAAALLRFLRIRFKKTLSATYVEVFRACALVLLISFGFILFPRVLPHHSLKFYAYVSLVTGLTLYYSTVIAEVVRSGIRSIPSGQTEAALTIGLTEGRAMRFVVLPQALRRALPNIVTQVASLFKDTSLGIFVTYEELTKRAQISGEFGGNNLQSFIVAGAMYFAFIAVLTTIANRLRAQQRR